jgi:hypothetical protein
MPKVQEAKMAKFDRTDMQRVAVSIVGALALTVASIIAAAAPAKSTIDGAVKGHKIEFVAK